MTSGRWRYIGGEWKLQNKGFVNVGRDKVRKGRLIIRLPQMTKHFTTFDESYVVIG